MTAQRSIAASDARDSRILQFRPGHVGGRVASAQPIARRGGTLRRPSVGGMATTPTDWSTVELLPTMVFNADANYPPANNNAGYTGGTDALSDGSDSTAVLLRHAVTSLGPPYVVYQDWLGTAMFGAVDVPDTFDPMSLRVTMRGRTVSMSTAGECRIGGVIDPYPGGVGYPSAYCTFDWLTTSTSTPPLSSSFQSWDSADNGPEFSMSAVPTADHIRAGIIRVRLGVSGPAGTLYDISIEVSDLRLIITSYPP